MVKIKRKVNPLGELVALRINSSQKRALEFVGDGNLSKGVRALIDLATSGRFGDILGAPKDDVAGKYMTTDATSPEEYSKGVDMYNTTLANDLGLDDDLADLL